MSFAMAVYSYAAQVRIGSAANQGTGFTMDERSPAQVYALVIGLTLVAAGIAGFFYNASFDTGDGLPRDAVLGILDVNGWHNVVHIVTGVARPGAWPAPTTARACTRSGCGAVYLLVAVARLHRRRRRRDPRV